MAFDVCCEVMAGQLALTCSDHPDIADCPDAVVIRSPSGEFQFPIRDGGTSFIRASFCPWCGSRLLPPEDGQDRAQWEADAVVLAQIGAQLFRERLSVEVEIPLDLATSATAAWERDDSDTVGTETRAQAVERHRAAALALIGLAISERGTATEDAISVSLDPWLIGPALDTADEMGLITPESESND
jgi:hypothetical protein